jgi:prepilin-type N-terminal cleavage/methylation domain-containing protein
MILDREHQEAGFSLIEVLLASAILATAVVPMIYVVGTGQRLGRAQAEASDLYQRVRVAADKLQRDLASAGAGSLAYGGVEPLSHLVAPLVPARTGLRSPDPELSAHPDRISVFYVPEGAVPVRLGAAMSTPDDSIRLDMSSRSCAVDGSCGFRPGQRALILDTRGAGHDVFTVTDVLSSPSTATQLARAPPNGPLSQPYGVDAVVVPIVQRVFHYDALNRRLMSYDGYQSDMPLIDHVAELRFDYFGEARGATGLEPFTLTQLADGPGRGAGPLQFDEDLLRIRLVRVALRLEAAGDEVRGVGPLFRRPGRSNSAYSYVPDYEVTFEVTPRNMVPR